MAASAPDFPAFVRTIVVRYVPPPKRVAKCAGSHATAPSLPPSVVKETPPDIVARRFALSLHLRNVLARPDQRKRLADIGKRLATRRVVLKVTALVGPLQTNHCRVRLCKPALAAVAPETETLEGPQRVVLGPSYGALTSGNDAVRALSE